MSLLNEKLTKKLEDLKALLEQGKSEVDPMVSFSVEKNESDGHRLAYHIAADMVLRHHGYETMAEVAIKGWDGNKICAIKRIKDKFNLTLKEAKQFVDWLTEQNIFPASIKRIIKFAHTQLFQELFKRELKEDNDEYALLTFEEARVFDLVSEVFDSYITRLNTINNLNDSLRCQLGIETVTEKICALRDRGFNPETIEAMVW